MFFRTISAMLFGVLMVATTSMAHAATYGPRDVEYVTSSFDRAVISYIICLNSEVQQMPRNIAMPDALDDAKENCQDAGYFLTSNPNEPDSREIRQLIIDCGFRPGEGKPGMRCGAVANPPVRVAPPRCRAPQVWRNGRCRAPVVVAPRCRAPQVWRNGRCRTPVVLAPTCRAPKVFRNGRCRNPVVVAPRCRAPKVWRNGRCRTPVVLAPRCRAPKVWRNGRCRR